MPFTERSFSNPSYLENDSEPRKILVISCEGRNTEPEYFETVVRKLSNHLKHLVKVDIVNEDVNASSPEKVLLKLEEHVESKYDFKEKVDILWLVIDRESVHSRKKQILEIIPQCAKKGYSLAITNPLFEFWLLMHVTDVAKYDKEILLANDWVTPAKKRRYIDKELSNILERGFNKKKGKFNQDIVSLDNIKRAIKQEEQFCRDIPDILDNLGSNVGILIEDFLNVN